MMSAPRRSPPAFSMDCAHGLGALPIARLLQTCASTRPCNWSRVGRDGTTSPAPAAHQPGAGTKLIAEKRHNQNRHARGQRFEYRVVPTMAEGDRGTLQNGKLRGVVNHNRLARQTGVLRQVALAAERQGQLRVKILAGLRQIVEQSAVVGMNGAQRCEDQGSAVQASEWKRNVGGCRASQQTDVVKLAGQRLVGKIEIRRLLGNLCPGENDSGNERRGARPQRLRDRFTVRMMGERPRSSAE